MNVEVEKSDSDVCIVRFGPLTRSDPDAEVQIVREKDDGNWERIERAFISGKKKMTFKLEPGKHHVAVIGGKITGVASTAKFEVPFPFNVFLEAPEDHSKDYMKVSIPANKPIEGDLKRSIKAALKN